METKTYTVYSFDELPERSKEKAIEKYRDINVNYDGWCDYILDDFKEKLEKQGWYDIEVSYSGFWSQGDGACYDGSLDIEKYIAINKLEKKFPTMWKYIQDGYLTHGAIHKNNYGYHYSHSKTRYFEIDDDTSTLDSSSIPESLNTEWDDLEKAIEYEREKLSDDLYSTLMEAYESYISDERIIDTLKENEYMFTLDGSIDA